MEGLKELYLNRNVIEKPPKGLFEHTPNLEIISFCGNKIKEIDSEILVPLKNLKYFDLMANASINVVYDTISLHKYQMITLEQFKEEIKKCAPLTDKAVIEMKKELSDLKHKFTAVEMENADLKNKVEELELNAAADKAQIAELKENEDLKKKVEELELDAVNYRA